MAATPVQSDEYDIAIIGGGLVGASLACALAPLGLKLCLVEAVEPKASTQPSYDDRTLALSASSCAILRGLGLWQGLLRHATSIREIHVRELHHAGSVKLDPQELGLENFGHVVEAREFGRVVLDALAGIAQTELLCPAQVQALEVGDGGVRVSYRSGQQTRSLRARLVVGADGADSQVRAAMGVGVERHDYGQTAIICNITPAELHHGRAFECFTATGPFAVLPHRDGRCGMVWSVASTEAAGLMQLTEEEFLQQARSRFGDTLGSFIKIGKRSSYPLKLVRAKADWRPRLLVIGNAAHTIHPIAAQGFNLGLRDVAVLAEVLAEALAEARRQSVGFDPGADSLLQRYSALRAEDQAETIAYTDGLARLYANPTSLAGALRRAGMLAHRLSPALRRRLAIKAMGFRGHIPLLAQGESLAAGQGAGQGTGLRGATTGDPAS
jgi:2-octaprenyl-6-methoxyphenol hydroxylase